MTLAMANVGDVVRLVEIHGGRHLRRRLADLGLNIGMTVTVVTGISQGPIILAVKESRLAIGRGMAKQIVVEKV